MTSDLTRRGLFFWVCCFGGSASALALASPTPSPRTGPPTGPGPSSTSNAPLNALVLGAQDAAADELSRSQELLERARSRLSDAQEAIEELVHALDDDYALLNNSRDAPSIRQALVLAMSDAVETARSRMAASAAQGRSMMRPSRTRVFLEVFKDPVRKSSRVDVRFADWIAARVADALGARSRLDDVDAQEVQRVVDSLFVSDESWPEFWNRSFHQSLPEALEYSSALKAYEDAGLQMERLRFPERYGPRGEPAPPGMRVIPGGTYTLGPNSGWSRPRRKQTLKPFALDRHEVTHREYGAFVDAQPAILRTALLPRGWTLSPAGLAAYDPARREHPVVAVNWSQAADYAAWAGKRLPTEDEWEAAAAGVEGRAYTWGNGYFTGQANGDGANEDTVPVESYPHARSPTGCFDLAGNVWEWTATLEDGTNITELPDGLVNIAIRGGSYRSERHELTTRARWTAPGQDAFSSPSYDRPIGFRCAKDVP